MSKIAISAFFAGAVCKMYDDLVDNPKLQKYKTEFLLELLKGLFYILFTFMSINDDVSFLFLYLTSTLFMYYDKKAFENPYEHSTIYSFLIIMLLIDYKCFRLSNWYEILPVFSCIIICSFYEPTANKEEYSIFKLIIRFFLLMWTLIFFYSKLFPSFNHLLIFGIGYLSISVITQLYSLLSTSDFNSDKKRLKKKKGLKKIRKASMQ